jgi:hypothetical protein
MNDLTVYRGKPISSDQLTKEQRDAVGYFFFRLKAIDPGEFDRHMPDRKTESIIKREYAGSLMGMTKEQMDNGFAALHDLRREGHEDFKFLNIDRVIGLMYESGKTNQAHKVFTPRLPESKEAKEERKARGREKCSAILSIFNE